MESIQDQLIRSKKATMSSPLNASKSRKVVLLTLADLLEENISAIVEANKKDLAQMALEDPKYDRLILNEERIIALAGAVRAVSNLEDPTGKILSTNRLENGLLIEKKTVALGVVGVIYESRPNVTIDVAALCIRSGNVCLLRGGSDAWNTNCILVGFIQQALQKHGLNKDIVQLLPTDRKLVEELLHATKYVDIIIPRGSESLIQYVRDNAKVPVIETGAGVCHTYIDATADVDMAANIVANAKISRPSVCNALDTILVNRELLSDFLEKLVPYFQEAHVEIFADDSVFDRLHQQHYPFLQRAKLSDFGREFLDLKCSIKVVNDIEEAIEHIAQFSSKHSECIVSNESRNIELFMNNVDAAAVYSNASTRFTDGGEFGLGAEIGISTQKLHARGPFALEKLVTEKWFVTGKGQVR